MLYDYEARVTVAAAGQWGRVGGGGGGGGRFSCTVQDVTMWMVVNLTLERNLNAHALLLS